MERELGSVENEPASVGVEQHVSFAYCGKHRGPEGLEKLRSGGGRFARHGQPTELHNHALEASLAC